MSYIIFGAVEGVYGPQNTPMLWQCIFAGTKEHFEFNTHPQPPPHLNTSTSLEGCCPSIWCVGVERKASFEAQGAFLPAAAMIVVVVTRIVFCAEPTEILKNAKTLKLVVCFENKFICK